MRAEENRDMRIEEGVGEKSHWCRVSHLLTYSGKGPHLAQWWRGWQENSDSVLPSISCKISDTEDS